MRTGRRWPATNCPSAASLPFVTNFFFFSFKKSNFLIDIFCSSVLADEDPRGVTMEQLKKLLRPATVGNNNDDDGDDDEDLGEEPIRITSSYRWQPSVSNVEPSDAL